MRFIWINDISSWQKKTCVICFWFSAFYLFIVVRHFTLKQTTAPQVTRFLPSTSQRPPCCQTNHESMISTWQCALHHGCTWLQTNFLLTLTSIILAPQGLCKTFIHHTEANSHPKENWSRPRNEAFNGVLIKNELCARMRTQQSTNITNYLAPAKWRSDQCGINCILPRSQWNNSSHACTGKKKHHTSTHPLLFYFH